MGEGRVQGEGKAVKRPEAGLQLSEADERLRSKCRQQLETGVHGRLSSLYMVWEA